MAEYIEREAVLDYIDHMPSELTSDGRRMIRRIRLTEYISDSIPAADVVPVVRCGECENWQSGWKPSAAKDGMHFCAMVGLCTSADWFCADGTLMDKDGDGDA